MLIRNKGFTIVELLIVVVVIAILAAITIIAYNGIRERADASHVASTLDQVEKKVLAYAALNADQYPASLTDAGMNDVSSYFYSSNNSTTTKMYCIVYTYRGLQYFVTNKTTSPTRGTCDGLVAWWPMNGNALDMAGGLATATVTGAPALVVGQNGLAQGAYEFTVNNQRLTQPAGWGAGIDFTQISGAVWVKRNSTGGTQGVLWSASNALHWELVNDSWRVRISGTDRTAVAPGSAVGEWAHVAFTHNRNTSSFTFYVNGQVVNTATANSGVSTFFTPNAGDVGGSLGGSRQWYGALDDMRIYNRELTSAEVAELYTLGAQ